MLPLATSCESCKTKIFDLKDFELNVQVTNRLQKEEKLRAAYSTFRVRKGLSEVNDLGKNEDGHKVSLCLECLLECFRAKFVEPAKLDHSA